MMKELEPGERVYHRDDPRGPRGDVHEVRDLGERGTRAYVFWPNRAAEWIGVEYLTRARP
jgi:hypothetical protein